MLPTLFGCKPCLYLFPVHFAFQPPGLLALSLRTLPEIDQRSTAQPLPVPWCIWSGTLPFHFPVFRFSVPTLSGFPRFPVSPVSGSHASGSHAFRFSHASPVSCCLTRLFRYTGVLLISPALEVRPALTHALFRWCSVVDIFRAFTVR